MPLTANAGTFTTLYRFGGGNDGGFSVLTYHGGQLFGTTPGDDGSSLGTLFQVDAASGKYKLLHAFQGGNDGIAPENGVIYQSGMLYGTTAGGGGEGCVVNGYTFGCGTIFSFNLQTGNETVVYAFPQTGGLFFPGSLIYAGGTFYGDTQLGGASGNGSVFNFNPAASAFTTLYNFSGAGDGSQPNVRLLYQNGLLYGTTMHGGKGCARFGGCGMVFSVNPATGTKTTIHVFGSAAGGKDPYSNLIYQGGSLIGDTLIGGNPACVHGCGVSFKIKVPTGHEKVLDTFATRAENYSGQTEVGEIVYETIPSGGGGNGELLQVDLKSGQQTVLYVFTGGSDGRNPVAPLAYHDGALYGTTNGRNGTIFKYTL